MDSERYGIDMINGQLTAAREGVLVVEVLAEEVPVGAAPAEVALEGHLAAKLLHAAELLGGEELLERGPRYVPGGARTRSISVHDLVQQSPKAPYAFCLKHCRASQIAVINPKRLPAVFRIGEHPFNIPYFDQSLVEGVLKIDFLFCVVWIWPVQVVVQGGQLIDRPVLRKKISLARTRVSEESGKTYHELEGLRPVREHQGTEGPFA